MSEEPEPDRMPDARHDEKALFEKAKEYEKIDPVTGERYTWNQKESLVELSSPERIQEIKEQIAALL